MAHGIVNYLSYFPCQKLGSTFSLSG